ncbi:MAG: sulfotransferase domain-containing protein [Verrucomicrobiota bacterium]
MTRQLHRIREEVLARFMPRATERVWLNSFPRSGNTWLRRLLYHSLFGNQADEAKIRKTVPDIHRGWDVFNLRNSSSCFAKSHFSFSPIYQRVVYMIRDPLDTLASYGKYERLEIGAFLERELDSGGIYGRWDDHVRSYLDAGLSNQQLLVLRYESMLENPVEAIRSILTFANLDFDEGRVFSACETELNRLLGNDAGTYEEKLKQSLELMRNKGAQVLSDDQRQQILDSPIGELRKELGYS